MQTCSETPCAVTRKDSRKVLTGLQDQPLYTRLESSRSAFRSRTGAVQSICASLHLVERPQNERHNGLFQVFVPKGVSIEAFSAEYILAAADELNGRPARSRLPHPGGVARRVPRLCFTQPKAVAASPRTEASGFHPDRRSDSLSSTVCRCPTYTCNLRSVKVLIMAH